MKNRSITLALVAALLALPALAAAPVADVSLGTVQVEWQPTGEFAGLKLRVSGPAGVVEREFAAGENPSFDLRTIEDVADGLYTWELVAAPRLDEGVRRAMAEARAQGDDAAVGRLRESGALPAPGGLIQSGHFTVAGGAILAPSGQPEAAPAGPRRVTSDASSGEPRRVAAADQVIPDDLIVQGSICVGFDCVNNESFGFDTIRLKENNTRIKFEDTSVGTFPSNDWQLTANDSTSGGANKFSIEDITGAKVPFTLTAGAATNSIFVDSTGRVGFRTSTPVLDLHIATGNTPAIRLEQNNAGGFTAQTWDIGANEANFFVRDVSGGSLLPFRIRPGAPTSSVDISADGDVGIGTGSPAQKLHVVGSDGSNQVLIQETSGTEAERTMLAMENNGVAVFALEDTSADGSTWAFETEGPSFRVNKFGTGGEEIIVRDRFDGSGSATLVVNGSVQATNVVFASSRDFKTSFEQVDPRDVLSRLVALPMSRWEFKNEQLDRLHIGPMAEDFHAAFDLGGDASHISVLDASGVTMAAVQGLHQELLARDERIDDLQQELAELKALVERLSQASR